jgi:hypothetical protein
MVSDYLAFHGIYIPCRGFGGWLIDRCRLDSIDPREFTLDLRYWPGSYLFNILDYLDVIKRDSSGYNFNENINPGPSKISSLDYSLTDEYFVITYHMYVENTNLDISYEWDSKIVVPFGVPATLNGANVGDWVAIPGFTNVRFSYRNFHQSKPHPDPDAVNSAVEDEWIGGYSSAFPISYPAPSLAEDDFVSYRLISKLDSYVGNFHRAVNAQYRDLTSAAMFSTVDAFKQAEGYLGTNILQNLAKIPSITTALPQIKEGVALLSRILKRDLSGSTLKELLDLATSTNLQANFQWRPYIGLFTEYLPLMVSTFRSIGLPTGVSIGRGSYSKTLSNVFGRESVTVQARTKIVMDRSPNGLLSAVLAVDALGLLPKVSNLWDLVPFSFAANWFTGIGESIRRAEYTLLLATIPAYFVHSYKVTSPLTSSEQRDLGASSFGDDPASLVLYYRDVSFYCPAPHDSALGFGIPTELPPTGVLGSLLYQLIFS